MNILINKDIIKNMAGRTIYDRGVKCKENNIVKYLDVDLVEKEEVNIIDFNAIVRSSDLRIDYRIFLRVIESYDSITLNGKCSCPYLGEMCKHQVAILVEFLDNKEKYLRKFYRNEDKKTLKSDQIIENIKSKYLRNVESNFKNQLDVQYKLIVSSGYLKSMYLEMKIGDERLYVVKNIKEFIESILSNNTMYFGKKFTFNPSIHYFKEEDKKIFKILYAIYETDQMLQNPYNVQVNKYNFFKGKSVKLTDSNLQEILKLLKGRNITFQINNEEFEDVYIGKNQFPLDFKLKYKEDKLVLTQLTEIAAPITDKGQYFFYRGNIYEVSDEYLTYYKAFLDYFINENKREIEFRKEDSEDIASYILPTLKKISTNIDIDEKFKDKFLEIPLKAMIYLDKEDRNITASIIFKYGSEKIDSLSQEERDKKVQLDKVLIRDIKGENEVINVLKSFGFEKEIHKYKLKNQDEILNFIEDGIDKLRQCGEIYYSENFKNIKVYRPSSYQSSVKLNREDLLEFTFNIQGVDRKELKDIFEALNEKKKYYRLKNGAFIDLLNNDIREAKSLIDNLNITFRELEKDNVILPKSNAVYIDSLINENKMNFIEESDSFKELIENINTIDKLKWKVPKNLDKVMRKYQKFGFKWFKTLASLGFGGILADEMGLGKTLQTIAFIKSESDEKEKLPCIVVCPTSLVYNWEDEINKFQPDLKIAVVSGSKKERIETIKKVKDLDIVITSYALMRRDIENYIDIKFKYCFIDEAQNIKNANSLNAKSVKAIKSKSYFALTGTPIENSLGELWSIFDFIMPGYLFNKGKFSKKYEIPIAKSKDKRVLKELNRRIKPFILRRLKKDVIKELPSKIEHNIVVDMTEDQKKIYASFSEKAKSQMLEKIKQKEFNKSKIQILAMITRLRQICCDPTTCIENYNGGSGKMDALLNIITSNKMENHKMLVFSQFTSVLKNISERLQQNEIEHLYLDGSVKSNLRGDIVKKFNEEDIKVFLISLKAGGTGLNLTSADIVIHYDPWWNPSVEEQATDRAHRIGQENTVEVIRLIAKGSIEEKINKIQKQKKEMIKNVMDENVGNEISILNMSEDEIKDLFS